MQQLVVWCGQQILLHIDVGRAAFLRVCHCVQIVSKLGITTDTTSTCSVVRREGHVTAGMSVS